MANAAERKDGEGQCNSCGSLFPYFLIHNGFNESAYAYCSGCGMTCILDTGYEDRPGIPRHRSVEAAGERKIAPCICGGKFRAGALPRCPHCRVALDATKVTEFIERNALGAKLGWRWQKNWVGLYCIVIDARYVINNWIRTASDR